MREWRGTASLARSLVVGGVSFAVALLLGRPAVVVLGAPFVVFAVLALRHRPRTPATVTARLDHATLHEGQGTRSRLQVTEADGVEWVTRVAAPAAHVALHPTNGVFGYLATDPVELEISPRRWGRRQIGEERVGLFSPWAGFREGPVPIAGLEAFVLPVRAPYDSRTEAPQPIGLVGAHRSQRVGTGTEFAGIRQFRTGDRLRRINWRVSLRSGDLHVVTARAEEDTAVLLIVDGITDFGRSGGVGGAASSLDVTMRAAAAIAEQHVHGGDRVGLRVVGGDGEHVGYGTGERHLRRILGQLARVRPGRPRDLAVDQIQFGATAGTVVIVLSPMLEDAMATAVVKLVRSGLAVMVIDTLPPDAEPDVPDQVDPRVAALAWRMRRPQRDHVLDRLAEAGCPVVPWRGPGTLDVVMHRLARRASVPRVAAR